MIKNGSCQNILKGGEQHGKETQAYPNNRIWTFYSCCVYHISLGDDRRLTTINHSTHMDLYTMCFHLSINGKKLLLMLRMSIELMRFFYCLRTNSVHINSFLEG